MNIYLIIIVVALLMDFFLHNLSKILDLKNLSTKLPNEFDGYYSEDEYYRSQTYLKENTRFTYLTSSFNLLVILLAIFLGLFTRLFALISGAEMLAAYFMVHAGNNVVDRQVVNMEFDSGPLVTLIMHGHAAEGGRSMRYDGTKGTPEGVDHHPVAGDLPADPAGNVHDPIRGVQFGPQLHPITHRARVSWLLGILSCDQCDPPRREGRSVQCADRGHRGAVVSRSRVSRKQPVVRGLHLHGSARHRFRRARRPGARSRPSTGSWTRP